MLRTGAALGRRGRRGAAGLGDDRLGTTQRLARQGDAARLRAALVVAAWLRAARLGAARLGAARLGAARMGAALRRAAWLG